MGSNFQKHAFYNLVLRGPRTEEKLYRCRANPIGVGGGSGLVDGGGSEAGVLLFLSYFHYTVRGRNESEKRNSNERRLE